MNYYNLNNGHMIPQIGFGTWKLEEGPMAYESVLHALEAGYRHIDTAQDYQNESSVGLAISESPVPREEIFLTTKVWNRHHTYHEAANSIEESMNKLKVDYLDLLLIHWPNPHALRESKGADAWIERNREVWRAMEDAVNRGKVRTIGVSNFMIHHLESLLETAVIKSAVNQIKLAPGLTQDSLVAFCREHKIVVEAYSPLGHGTAFKHQDIIEIAKKYPDKTPAQVALRWSLEKGYLPLPKSKTPANISSNLEIFDFNLDHTDIEKLNKVVGVIENSDPDLVEF